MNPMRPEELVELLLSEAAIKAAAEAVYKAWEREGETTTLDDARVMIEAAINIASSGAAQSSGPANENERPVHDAAWRFYLLLSLFDRRDGTGISDLVHTAREAYEREEFEPDAWEQFDALWNRLTSSERLNLTRMP